MENHVFTEQERKFVMEDLQTYCAELVDRVKNAILETESAFDSEAEKRGLKYPYNPANADFLTAALIQDLLDFLCKNDPEIAVKILTNEANRLNVEINTKKTTG